MADLTPLAGLNVAPPYDPSKELDPDSVRPMATPFDVEKLEYFQKRQESRTWYARVTLLCSLVFLIFLNIWTSSVQHEAAMAELAIIRSEQISNIDQARLGQVELQEITESQLAELSAAVGVLDARLVKQEAPAASGAVSAGQ
jgi:hypothetical protein